MECLGPEDQVSVRKDFLSRRLLSIILVVAVVVDIKAVDCVHEEGDPAKQADDHVEDLLLDEH